MGHPSYPGGRKHDGWPVPRVRPQKLRASLPDGSEAPLAGAPACMRSWRPVSPYLPSTRPPAHTRTRTRTTTPSQVKLPNGRLVGTFVGFLVPGTLLLLLFAVLIPGFWFITVWRHRHQLEVRQYPALPADWSAACWAAARCASACLRRMFCRGALPPAELEARQHQL